MAHTQTPRLRHKSSSVPDRLGDWLAGPGIRALKLDKLLAHAIHSAVGARIHFLLAARGG